MAPEPRPSNRVIASYLDEVALELEAVRRLLDPTPVRFAAFHLQQAAEKICKAVLLHRGRPATKEHRLEILVESLPAGDPWKPRLGTLEHLSAYATAFRYPTPAGRIPAPPEKAVLLNDLHALEALLDLARTDLLAPAP